MGEIFPKKLVLFGAGGMGREVLEMIKKLNHNVMRYDVLGFLVEKEYYRPNAVVNGLPILGTEEWILEHKEEVWCSCTIGTAKEKARIQNTLMQQGVKFETLAASDVIVPSGTIVGAGCVFKQGVKLSVNCSIGNGVFLNGGVTIGHDVSIEDYTCIMTGTGISGNCKIGTQVNIGGHAYVIPKKEIGNFATVAAGSIVFTHVKPGTTVLGNPAKRMKCLEEE